MADWTTNPLRFADLRRHTSAARRAPTVPLANVSAFAVAAGLILCLATVIVPVRAAAAATPTSTVSSETIPAGSAAGSAAADSSATTAIVTTPQQLTDAVTATTSSGSVIRLAADIVGGAVFVPEGASVALELNGHSLTAAGASGQAGVGVPAGAALSIAGPGTLTATGGAHGAGIGGANGAAGRITILGGTVVATGGALSTGIGSTGSGSSTNSNSNSSSSAASPSGTDSSGARTDGSALASAIDPALDGVITIGVGAIVVASSDGDGPGVSGSAIGIRSVASALTAAVTPAVLIAGSLVVPAGNVLTVPAGATVVNTGSVSLGGSIQNAGVVDNRGRFLPAAVPAGAAIVQNAGVVLNSGTIDPGVTLAGDNAVLRFHAAGLDGVDTLLTLHAAGAAATELPTSVQDAARTGFIFARAGHALNWSTAPGPGGTSWDAAAPVARDQDLYAQWSLNTHTVTFVSAGGTAIPPLTVEYGSAALMPANPVRAGFVFAGWSIRLADGVNVGWDPSSAVTADLTLQAEWMPATHTVSFDSRGGSGIPTQTVGYGERLAAPLDPTLMGHTFAGWYFSVAGQETRWDAAAPVLANLSLFARWEPAALALPATFITARSWPGSASASASADELSASGAAPDAEVSAAGILDPAFPWWAIGLVAAGAAGMGLLPRRDGA